MALDELKREDLLEENAAYDFPFAGMSRREAIRKAGGLATMVALPLISSLIAPTAAMAQSGVSCVNSGENPDSTPVATISNDSCGACRNFLNSSCCSNSVTNFNCTGPVPFDPFTCSDICGT